MPYAATWMDLEIIILREVSQTSIIGDHSYVGSNKSDIKELIRQTDSQIRKPNLWFPKGKRRGDEEIGRLGLTYIHYIKYLSSKDLVVYSTGNSSQCSVEIYIYGKYIWEKNLKKNGCICIYN